MVQVFPGKFICYELFYQLYYYDFKSKKLIRILTYLAMMASHGIASLALAYFNYADLPNNLNEFELEYFGEAVDILLSTPHVIPDHCGAIGISQGAGYAYLMGVYLSSVKLVIAINSPPILAFSKVTYKGETIIQPFPVSLESNLLQVDENNCVVYNFDNADGNMVINHSSRIPLEKANEDTTFYSFVGTEDVYYIDRQIKVIQEYLQENGKAICHWEFFEGAGHIIDVPFTPFILKSYQPYWPRPNEEKQKQISGVIMHWGGEAKAAADAQVKSWDMILNYINRHIKDESPWYESWLSKCKNTVSAKL